MTPRAAPWYKAVTSTQAIFSLKGKPLNCYGLKRDVVYKNEELYNIMRALGIEGVENLRHGWHCPTPTLTVCIFVICSDLFLRFFEELITHGHVYILETPLFRVRNKKKLATAIVRQSGMRLWKLLVALR